MTLGFDLACSICNLKSEMEEGRDESVVRFTDIPIHEGGEVNGRCTG